MAANTEAHWESLWNSLSLYSGYVRSTEEINKIKVLFEVHSSLSFVMGKRDATCSGALFPTTHLSCISNNITTAVVNNSNSIWYNSLLHRFSHIFKGSLRVTDLLLQVFDDDKFDNSSPEFDLIDEWLYSLHLLTHLPNHGIGQLTRKNNTFLQLLYSVECDEHFYGMCNKHCKPDPDRYTCNMTGSRICKRGWNGKNCTLQDCSSRICENNGTCVNVSSALYCSCSQNFTGLFCEINLSEMAVTSQPTESYKTLFSRTPASKLLPFSKHAETVKQQGSQTYAPDKKIGLYAGISVGVLLVLALALGGTVYYVLRQKNKIESGTKRDDEETHISDASSNTRRQ